MILVKWNFESKNTQAWINVCGRANADPSAVYKALRISVVNNTVRVYDSNGSALALASLNNFIQIPKNQKKLGDFL